MSYYNMTTIPSNHPSTHSLLGVETVKIRVLENGPTDSTKVFLASKTYDKQLKIENMGLSPQVWSRGGSTFRKNDIKQPFSRPAITDPYVRPLLLSVNRSI